MYINFEGVDGTGKSTCMKLVAEKLENSVLLKKLGIENVITTKEPKGFFREIILDANNKYNLTEMARMFLFQADRALHTENVIRPNINKSDTIILGDRGILSTLAYQSVILEGTCDSDNILNDLKTCVNLATNGIMPDFIFMFRCEDINILKKRLSKLDKDYFDKKDEYFFEEIQDRYEEIIDSNWCTDDISFIDASQELDFIVEIIYNKILNIIIDKKELNK